MTPDASSSPSPGSASPTPVRPAASAIASLVLGILSVLLAIGCVGFVPGVVGMGLGWHARRKHPGSRRLASWGLGTSALGVVLSLVVIGTTVYVARNLDLGSGDGAGATLSRWEGVEAPDLTVTRLDGTPLRLRELRGKRVVLDFWATWCGPCVQEIPHFVQLYQDFGRDQLEIVGISDEEADTLRRFVKKENIPYPIGNAVDPVAPYNQIQAYPTTFFIDRRGIIQSVAVGYHDLEFLREKALAPDTVGDPQPAPAEAPTGLRPADTVRTFKPVWNRSVPTGLTVACGDWEGNGVPQVIVAGLGTLQRFGWEGDVKETRPWPNEDSILEVGRTRSGEARIATYSNWGKKVRVVDRAGQELWSHPSKSGVNGAHWGDLDGDGDDELVVGHNGGGGLEALGIDGKLRWQVGGLGNVWCQAVIPARDGQPGRVFITEATGSVHLYDAVGAALERFQLDGRYCAAMTGAWMGPEEGIQVIGESGREFVAVADSEGEVRWRLPVKGSPGNWRTTQFVAGDLTGDGTPEWILRDDRTLVVASPDGIELGRLESKDPIQSFAVLRGVSGPGRLAVLFQQLLIVYEFQ